MNRIVYFFFAILISASPKLAFSQATPCTAVAADVDCAALSGVSLPAATAWTAAGSGIVNPPCGGAAGGTTVTGNSNYWITLTTGASDYGLTLDFRRPGSGGGRIDDIGLQVYTAAACGGAFTLVGCYNNTASTDVYQDIAATPSTTYYIRVFDTDGSGGGAAFEYCIRKNPRGNTPCSAIPISSFPYSFTGSTATAGFTNFMTGGCDGNEPATTGSGNDVFFSVTLAANSYLTLQLTGTTAANFTELTALSATSCDGPWTCVTNGAWTGGLQADNSPASSSSPCRTAYFAAAGTYYLRVDASLSANGPFTISVNSYTPTGGDACANATTLSSGTPLSIVNTNCVYTTGTDDPTGALICAGTLENTQWTAFTASGTGGSIAFDVSSVTCATGYYAASAGPFGGYYSASGQFGILTSSTNACGGTYTAAVACQSLATGATYSGTLTNTAGTNYYFVWDGNGGAECNYTITATNIIPLPIQLIFFEAKKDLNKVNLQWKTSMEKNCNQFILEKSLDAINFEKIGSVKANGNTNSTSEYSFIDFNPYTNGTSYYRLKQTDYNADESISSMKVVEFENAIKTNFIIFPNPSIKGESTIKTSNFNSEELHVVIEDLSGKQLFESSFTNIGSDINIQPNLPAGMYLIKVQGGNEGVIRKFSVIE